MRIFSTRTRSRTHTRSVTHTHTHLLQVTEEELQEPALPEPKVEQPEQAEGEQQQQGEQEQQGAEGQQQVQPAEQQPAEGAASAEGAAAPAEGGAAAEGSAAAAEAAPTAAPEAAPAAEAAPAEAAAAATAEGAPAEGAAAAAAEGAAAEGAAAAAAAAEGDEQQQQLHAQVVASHPTFTPARHYSPAPTTKPLQDGRKQGDVLLYAAYVANQLMQRRLMIEGELVHVDAPTLNLTLFLGNLGPETTAEKVEEEMAHFGTMERCFVMTGASGRPKGYAFVEFSLPSATKAAKTELDKRWRAEQDAIRQARLSAQRAARARWSQKPPSTWTAMGTRVLFPA